MPYNRQFCILQKVPFASYASQHDPALVATHLRLILLMHLRCWCIAESLSARLLQSNKGSISAGATARIFPKASDLALAPRHPCRCRLPDAYQLNLTCHNLHALAHMACRYFVLHLANLLTIIPANLRSTSHMQKKLHLLCDTPEIATLG